MSAPKHGRRCSGSFQDPSRLAAIRLRFESGERVQEIADDVLIDMSTIYTWKRKFGWQRREEAHG